MGFFKKKVDLARGYGKNNISYTENALQDLLSTAVKAMDNYSNKKLRNVLSSIELTVGNAGKFTSEGDYNNAMQVIDTLKGEVPHLDSVSSAIVQNYENTLNAHRNNFVADSELTNMFYNVKNDLTKLDEFNSSENLHEVLKSLEQLVAEYRPNASANVLKMGDKLHQDVRDAIWVADNLRRVDFDQDTPEWEFNDADYSTADQLFKWGDFDGAKKYLIKGSKVQEQKLWRSTGAQYRGNIDRFVAKQKEFLDMYNKYTGSRADDDDMNNAKALNENSIFRHIRFVPKFGKQELNPYNIDEAKTSIDEQITSIFLDKDNVDFGDSALWALFRDAYDPPTGAVDSDGNPRAGGASAVLETLKNEMHASDKVKYSDLDAILYPDMIHFLSENIQFVPDEPGWEMSLGAKWNEPIEGSNKLGAEFFMELLKIGLDLEESQNKIDSYKAIKVGYDMFGMPE